MKVKDLIKELNALNPEAEVCMRTDSLEDHGGPTFFEPVKHVSEMPAVFEKTFGMVFERDTQVDMLNSKEIDAVVLSW